MPLARLDLALGAGITNFAEPVTYRPATGGSFTLNGVWRAAHTPLDLGGETVVSTVSPALGVKLADFPVEPLSGDQFDRGLVAYQVDDVQPDGQGGAELICHNIS